MVSPEVIFDGPKEAAQVGGGLTVTTAVQVLVALVPLATVRVHVWLAVGKNA